MSFNYSKLQAELQIILDEVEKQYNEGLPLVTRLDSVIRKRIDSWPFGKYGSVSPLNILFTSAWYKWLYPKRDSTSIWAQDENGRPIESGYPSRSLDENVTVPFMVKNNLTKDFCSPNGGLQGCRALEKARELRTLHRDKVIPQKVRWDKDLFLEIINDINDSDSSGALLILQYFLVKALAKRDSIVKTRLVLKQTKVETEIQNQQTIVYLKGIIDDISDPRLVEIVAHQVLSRVLNVSPSIIYNAKVKPLSATLTGADARSRGAGDIEIVDNDMIIAGGEAKLGKRFKYTIIEGIRTRLGNNPEMKVYFLLTTTENPLADSVDEIEWVEITSKLDCKVIWSNLYNFMMVNALYCEFGKNFLDDITSALSDDSVIKRETMEKWLSALNSIGLV